MEFLAIAVALLAAVGASAYFVWSVERGKSWALAYARVQMMAGLWPVPRPPLEEDAAPAEVVEEEEPERLAA